MVASVSALSSAGQAASYYEADDYYAEGGMAPSEWFGEAAEKLGLSGEVDREKFAELLEGRVPVEQCETLDRAVAAAAARAEVGDTVLLSPACASFDQYADFEKRGEHFRALVEGLK